MKAWRFAKMHGLGNDFMVLDGVSQHLTLTPEAIRALANRHTGVGFDQLMLVTKAPNATADFGYRVFNQDGCEVEQCGNGVRCVARYIQTQGWSSKESLILATPSHQMIARFCDDGHVCVNMSSANFEPASLPFAAEHALPFYDYDWYTRPLSFGAVSVGNPHIVFDVPDVDQAEVDVLGEYFNNAHPLFPKGVNVGFMQRLGRDSIALKVYERGAGQTLACGTGACAAVSIGQKWGLLDSRVRVGLPGGHLSIECAGAEAPIYMTGPAVIVYHGQLDEHNCII